MARKQKKSDRKSTNSVELVAPSDKRFRSKVLTSVGLDDDDDDSYDKCEDIGEAGTRRLDNKNKSENKRRRGEDKASENLELLEEEDEEDCEYDALDQSNSTSTTRCSTLKPIFNNLLWILLTVAAVIYIFYDDEMLEESETDEDVIQKQQPYSYNGYVDARIPTDDEAQFGGGLNDVGAALPSQDDDDELAKEMINEFGHHHDPTGIVEVDILWEQLDGYAEISEPLDDHDLPVFWHIPKCGGTTLQDMMSHCFGMIEANEVGKTHVKDELEIIALDNGNRYVNVDLSNPNGIEHAKDLGFGASGLANVAITSWFHDTASLFDDDIHRGRCFLLVRHPIRRAVSLFYYLKDATWEHTYSDVYKEMDLEEYATSQYSEDNWMTRFLTNQMSGNVYDRHLDLAKEVLESKCLVGLMEDFSVSINRFDHYFGWSQRDFGGPVSMANRGTCVARVIQHPDNAHPHPKVEEDGEVWNLLLKKNKYDLALYEHARHLFYNVQSDIVS